MGRKDKTERKAAPAGAEKRSSSFDNLPVEGWFWELIRRDGHFKKRFGQIDQAVQEFLAARLSPDEYARRLKSYLAHLRRYGVRTSGFAAAELVSRRMKTDCYLLLPVPGKDKVFAAPRPEAAYLDFGDGPKPAPRGAAMATKGFSRGQIRKLLAKHGLLEKRELPEDAPAPERGSDPDVR
jgi:hypothetical protein